MNPFLTSNIKLGILKGGQLGRMLLRPCIDFDVMPYVMDNDPQAPCKDYCAHFIVGDALNVEDVCAFGRQVDVLTLEYENVSLEALRQLQDEGVKVYPSPDVVAVVQDKGLQKQFYQKHGFPTAEFHLIESRDEIAQHADLFPVVQKLRQSGYDGHGVQVLSDPANLSDAFDAPSVLEQKVDIAKELAVVVARNVSGDIVTYPMVEMVFHAGKNMLDYHFAPARVDDAMTEQADKLARALAEQLGVVGLLAVELFVTKDGTLLINEIAPRPHNSGHHTIEANVTSQFEQHVRAVLDLPLGSVDMRAPSVMLNLVGEPDHQGSVAYQGLHDMLGIPGVHLHRYGKKETRPYRKMGHITVTRPSLEEALKVAEKIKQTVKVISCQK